jgi:hypothetical protein
MALSPIGVGPTALELELERVKTAVNLANCCTSGAGAMIEFLRDLSAFGPRHFPEFCDHSLVMHDRFVRLLT